MDMKISRRNILLEVERGGVEPAWVYGLDSETIASTEEQQGQLQVCKTNWIMRCKEN